MPNNSERETIKRYQGCLVGAAVGDALGAPPEFHSTAEIYQKYGGPLTEMVGGGHFNWKVGETTDDTAMSMGIVDSVVNKGSYNPVDVAAHFVDWLYSGPKDIGGMTFKGLKYIAEGGDYRQAGKNTLRTLNTAPNGSIMRTAPVGLIFRNNTEKMFQVSDEISAMTHAHPECLLACRMASHMIGDLVSGADKWQALERLQITFQQEPKAIQMIDDALSGNYHREVYESVGGGYVFESFNIALHAFMGFDNFEDAVIYAVNLGRDTDSQGTVTAAFAGAHYGIDAIPERWKQPLNPFSAAEIAEKAQQLYFINKNNYAQIQPSPSRIRKFFSTIFS